MIFMIFPVRRDLGGLGNARCIQSFRFRLIIQTLQMVGPIIYLCNSCHLTSLKYKSPKAKGEDGERISQGEAPFFCCCCFVLHRSGFIILYCGVHGARFLKSRNISVTFKTLNQNSTAGPNPSVCMRVNDLSPSSRASALLEQCWVMLGIIRQHYWP